ncbi:TPA: hypothetical protein HA244_03730 [Candidatus Micrarchaeota archaeon]|nr:hypothetical protein [Candidatus Micrarchaeota archaeon]
MAIEGRLVQLGNSVAIAISKKDAEEQGWKLNQKIEFVEIRKNRKQLLEKMLGMAKGAGPFIRDEE